MNKLLKFKKQIQQNLILADLSVIMVVKKLFIEDNKEISAKLKWYSDTYQLIKEDSELISQIEFETFLDIHSKAIRAINNQDKIDIDFIFNNNISKKLTLTKNT